MAFLVNFCNTTYFRGFIFAPLVEELISPRLTACKILGRTDPTGCATRCSLFQTASGPALSDLPCSVLEPRSRSCQQNGADWLTTGILLHNPCILYFTGDLLELVIVIHIWQKLSSVERNVTLIITDFWQLLPQIFGETVLALTSTILDNAARSIQDRMMRADVLF